MIYMQCVTNIIEFRLFARLSLCNFTNRRKLLIFCRQQRKGHQIQLRNTSYTKRYLKIINMNSTDFEWIRHVTINSSPHQANWLYAALCSALVGLSGLVPIVLLTDNQRQLSSLRWMLSFAVGGLLGDVFLHLLPEALQGVNTHEDFTTVGLCVLAGLLTFTILEKTLDAQFQSQKSLGYLNLIANAIDNFNHGLAVGAAFMVSNKVGFVTTGCILIHEIPHEVGDFAILMKSGFNRIEAAKAQFSTALIGMFGAMIALVMDWNVMSFFIVPFTCGGFLHIALISVLPDLLESEDWRDFLKVMTSIVAGIGTMTIASCL